MNFFAFLFKKPIALFQLYRYNKNMAQQTNKSAKEKVKIMAFDIANKSSLRLNRIPEGSQVVLVDFVTKATKFENAKFIGWFDGETKVESPKVIKSMPQNWVMKFEALDAEQNTVELKLVKDPAGFGAMFLEITKDEKTTLRRMTAYAAPEVHEAYKASVAKKESAPEVTEETVSEPEAVTQD